MQTSEKAEIAKNITLIYEYASGKKQKVRVASVCLVCIHRTGSTSNGHTNTQTYGNVYGQ
jgi:hypothetical protein